MRYAASETAAKHERILDEATRLFRERGFDGVAIPEIMKAAGLTHGSFYNHFESKADLMQACIGHGGDRSLNGIENSPQSEAGKLAYIKEYLSMAHRDEPGSGCLMSTLGSEVCRSSHAHVAMTEFVSAFISKFASHFPWSQKRQARRNAIQTTASMVGAMVLARAVQDEELAKEILREVNRGIRGNFKEA